MNNSTNATIGALFPSPPTILFLLTGLLGVGTLGIVGSTTVIVVILRNKSLRSSCFELIAAGSFGSCLVAIYHVTNGLHITGFVAGIWSMEHFRWECALLNLPGLWGIPFHSLLVCFVGFDRLCSLAAPIRHRHFGKSYVSCVIIGCAAFVTVQSAIAIGTVQLDEIGDCKTLDDIMSVPCMKVYGSLNIFYYSTAVLIYLSILACCRWKTRAGHHNAIEAEAFAHQPAVVIPTVRLMITSYFVCGLLGEIIINTALHLEVNQTVYFFRAVGINLKVLSSLVEICSLLLRSSKFRECFKACFHIGRAQTQKTMVRAVKLDNCGKGNRADV